MTSTKVACLVFCPLYLLAAGAAGTTYYVSTSGRDANDGLSPRTPFASLAKAASAAKNPGDAIALKKGDVWSSGNALKIGHGGTSGAPIVWDGGRWGSGANAVIRSNANRGPRNMAVVNIIGSSYLTLQNVTIDANNTQAFGLVIGGTDGFYSAASRQDSESYITVQDATIKNCGNGGDYRICVLVQTWNNSMSNITLQRLLVDGADDEGVAFYPGKSQDGATPAQISNSYFGYSTVTNYGRRNSPMGAGLLVNNRTSGILIEHNTIRQGPYGHGTAVEIASNEDKAGYFPTGTILRYNELHVSDGFALAIQGGQAKTADIHYNKISSDTTQTSPNAGAVVIWNAPARYANAALRFFNNTLYTKGGVSFLDNSQTPAVVTFRNNLVYNSGSDPYGQLCVYLDTPGSMVHSHNALYRSQGERMAVVSNSGYFYRNTLTRWEPTAVAADPAMTDPARSDFTLQAHSPAIDAGASLGGSADYAGTRVPQGRAPDIGAYERQLQ